MKKTSLWFYVSKRSLTTLVGFQVLSHFIGIPARAAPVFLNPELTQPQPIPNPPPDPVSLPNSQDLVSESSLQGRVINSLTTKRSNFSAWQRWLTTLSIEGEDALDWYINVGYENYFDYEGSLSLKLVPLQLGIQLPSQAESAITIEVGVDIDDRGKSSPSLALFAPVALEGSTYSLSTEVECRRLRVNTETLLNTISYCRGGPNIFWSITDSLSLFTFYRQGIYSDSNREHQTYARLNQKLGDFELAINAFSWIFRDDLGSGYFSPNDFLVLSGEIGFDKQISSTFDCGISLQLGQQRLGGGWSLAEAYGGRCQWQQHDRLSASTQLVFSNVLEDRDTSYAQAQMEFSLNWQL
jgi:hypothetical protein